MEESAALAAAGGLGGTFGGTPSSAGLKKTLRHVKTHFYVGTEVSARARRVLDFGSDFCTRCVSHALQACAGPCMVCKERHCVSLVCCREHASRINVTRITYLSQDGELVYVDWMPQKDHDTGKIQSEYTSVVTSSKNRHQSSGNRWCISPKHIFTSCMWHQLLCWCQLTEILNGKQWCFPACVMHRKTQCVTQLCLIGKRRFPHPDRVFAAAKADYYHTLHDGPIVTLQRSPFFKDILLLVGGWTFSIWKEGVKVGPPWSARSGWVSLTSR